MKYFILSFISMLVINTSICFSQEAIGLNDGLYYYSNCNYIEKYDIVRSDENGNIVWKLTTQNNFQPLDSTQDYYIVFGYTQEKNNKITSNPNDYDYWLIEKKLTYEFNIYPNPNLGNFFIFSNNLKNDLKFEIYDSLNRLIINNQINKNLTEVNLNNLSRGIYCVKIFDNEKIFKFEKICIN